MIPHLHLVPDPSPTPDQQVADRLDGLLSPSTPLARYADIIARLPPEIADVLAAEYTRACRLSQDEALRYRPSVAALARACGLPRQTFACRVRRAAAAAAEAARGDIRNAAPGVRMVDGSPFRRRAVTPGTPRGKVLASRDKEPKRNQRGATMRAGNARGRAKRDEND